jgi:predicted  nucleic acid-binding Zn-ribbon protein
MADEIMAVDERVARLEKTVAKGFHELGQRIGGLEHRMGGLEQRMGGLEQRMGGLEQRMGGLEGRMDGLERRMARLEDRMDAFGTKLDVAVESLEGKMNLVLERLDAHTAEMRAITTAMMREYRADRRLTDLAMTDHRHRIEALEAADRGRSASHDA